MQEMLSPDKILDKLSNSFVGRARASNKRLFILSFLAGAFIAFAAQASTFASFNLLANKETLGIGKLVQGLAFTPGLIFVLLAGAELFTGNSLMVISRLDNKISTKELLRSWAIVYIGNFIGSVFIAFLMYKSGQWNNADALVGARTILIANGKVNLEFGQAIILAILCNWLVCLAVWMATGADSTVGKMLCAFFPISLFVTSGFEHSIANMYYVPAGIFAARVPEYAMATGLSETALASLNWSNFIIHNLIPVTLGNILGGVTFVAVAYWLAYRNKENI